MNAAHVAENLVERRNPKQEESLEFSVCDFSSERASGKLQMLQVVLLGLLRNVHEGHSISAGPTCNSAGRTNDKPACCNCCNRKTN